MAKILTTKGSAAALEDLIRRAEKEIYLISFSFIISDSYITRLKQASDKGFISSFMERHTYSLIAFEWPVLLVRK